MALNLTIVCGLIVSLIASSGLAEEELTELDDVVVTGTRTEKKLNDVPVRTELIKRAEIEETAARTLADAVGFTPGVRIENNCQNCNFSQLRLLGLEGPYSQILIDGQPLMSSVAAVYGIEHISARMIDRIEIVKGGGSALYGPGAVAGIVNVISRDPTEIGGDIEVTYEDIDGEQSISGSAVGDFVSRNGKTRASILGQIDSRDGYDRDGDGFTELGKQDMESAGIRLRHFFSDDADVTAEYTYTHEDRRGGDRLDLSVTKAEIAEWIETNRNAGSISWTHAPVEGLDYRLTAAFALTDRDTYYGAGMDPNAFGNSENPLYILDSQFNHYLEKHTLTWGGQYQIEELTDEQPAYDRSTDEKYTDAGFYAQDDWSLAEAVALVIGGRIDKHSEIDNMIPSPRVALKWDPDPSLDVRAAYASGFRAPQVFDEDLHITQVGGEGQVIRNDPDLKVESSSSYTLGAEWTPKAGPGFVLVEATGFYTGIEDAFSLDEQDNPSTDEAEFVRVNRGGAKVYGAELNLGYQLGDMFEAQISWVHQESEFDDPDDDFDSTDFFRTPDDYGIMKLSWRDPSIVDVFIGMRYTGEMSVPHYAGFIAEDRLETSETFLTWDASVARALAIGGNELTLTVGCKNITDEYQKDVDQGPDRDAGYVYGPRYPRTLYASVKFAF
jgi:outer membrane receptor for ferrienterochelin and colicins